MLDRKLTPLWAWGSKMKRDVFSELADATISYEALGSGMVQIFMEGQIISQAEKLVNAQENYAAHSIPADDLWADNAAINELNEV